MVNLSEEVAYLKDVTEDEVESLAALELRTALLQIHQIIRNLQKTVTDQVNSLVF